MQSSPEPPTFEHLRAQAASLGVDPTDDDLEAVLGFLAAILPALVEIERGLPLEAAPVDPYASAGETA